MEEWQLIPDYEIHNTEPLVEAGSSDSTRCRCASRQG